MKCLWLAWLVQIDVTSHCLANRNCIYCSRFIRHVRDDQKFFMSMETLEKALLSVKNFPKKIGIIGGEPTLHPEFKEMCKLIRKILPNKFVQLFTTGGARYEAHKELIQKTFSFVALNEHNEEQKRKCKHQPLTVAIQDVVEDEELMWKMIDDCWVQRRWCPTIGNKGAFFCEIAYAIDLILDGPGGYDIEPSWWQKRPSQFQDQVKRYCRYCGAAVPLERDTIDGGIEKISEGNYELYRKLNLPRISEDEIRIFKEKLTVEQMNETRKTWAPWNYRGDIQADDPELERDICK